MDSSKNYKFPFSSYNKRDKDEKRYASQKHLDEFEWLVLSDVKKGYFCKYCFFVCERWGGGDHTKSHLNKLVVQPLDNFSKLYGNDGHLAVHASREYHKNSVAAGKEFLKIQERFDLNVINRINRELIKQATENRLRLKSTIETVILLGRQNISFRGHRDDGPLNIYNDNVHNEGNFREILKYRIREGDTQLKTHFEQSSARATYISKTTQNE